MLACLSLAVMLLAGCGSSSSDSENGSEGSADVGGADAGGATPTAENPAVTTKVTTDTVVNDKVAVFFVGSPDNRSFGNSVAVGAERAAKALKDVGVTVTVVGNMDQPQQYERQATAFINKGYKYMIFAHGGVPDVTVKLAKKYPDVTICQMNAEIDPLPENACTINLVYQNGDFIAGALAGMVTKSNHVGAIIGPPFPILTSEMEGFLLGARWINPEMKVSQTAIESYTDVAPARAAAAAQLGSGADILFSATDQATQGLFQAAKQAPGSYVVPQYFDSYDLAPDVVLTTVLFNLDGVTQEMINRGVVGKVESENYLFDYKDGVGRLAPLRDHEQLLPEGGAERLSKIEDMISSGELEVPFLGEVGEAQKYDLSQLPAPPQ